METVGKTDFKWKQSFPIGVVNQNYKYKTLSPTVVGINVPLLSTYTELEKMV